MNFYDKEQKINNNININDYNLLNTEIEIKSNSLFDSYNMLITILFPNLSKEKNIFVNKLINLIKSQIKIFITILNLNDAKKIYDYLNINIQNLSKQITDTYNSTYYSTSSNEISNKDEIIENINKNDDINSNFNKDNIKYYLSNGNSDYNTEKNKKNKINIKQVKYINGKDNETPIKINFDINENNSKNKNITNVTPIVISSYTYNNKKNKNNFYTYINNNEQKNKSHLSSKNYKNKKLFNLTEKNKKNCKRNDSPSFFKPIVINLKQIKRNNSNFNNNSKNNKLNFNSCRKMHSHSNKYKNIESKVALFLKREDEFKSKRMNFQLYKKKASSTKKMNRKNEISPLSKSEDIYQFLPNSLKEPLDEYINKQRKLIFEERILMKNEVNDNLYK